MEVQLLKRESNIAVVVDTTFKNTHIAGNLPTEAQPKSNYAPNFNGYDPSKIREEGHITEKNRAQPEFSYADKIFYEELRLRIESSEP